MLLLLLLCRRVLCIKEIDFVGHFNREWECLFENFYRPPAVTGSELKIYCKVLSVSQPVSQPVSICLRLRPHYYVFALNTHVLLRWASSLHVMKADHGVTPTL